MVQPLPDPSLRRVLEERDRLAQELRNERKRSGILRAMLDRERGQRTNDAKPKPIQDHQSNC